MHQNLSRIRAFYFSCEIRDQPQLCWPLVTGVVYTVTCVRTLFFKCTQGRLLYRYRLAREIRRPVLPILPNYLPTSCAILIPCLSSSHCCFQRVSLLTPPFSISSACLRLKVYHFCKRFVAVVHAAH